jgi:hypothetical protein
MGAFDDDLHFWFAVDVVRLLRTNIIFLFYGKDGICQGF